MDQSMSKLCAREHACELTSLLKCGLLKAIDTTTESMYNTKTVPQINDNLCGYIPYKSLCH